MDNIEDLLGIKVIKETDACTKDSINRELDGSFSRLRSLSVSVTEALCTIRALVKERAALSEFIAMIGTKKAINKQLVKDIDVHYPDLLATVASIDDFTEALTSTNVSKVTNFLDKELVFIDDRIYQLYMSDVYAVIVELFKLEDLNDPSLLVEETKSGIDALYAYNQELMGSTRLSVFKDGKLYPLAHYALSKEFISMIKMMPISDIDNNSLLSSIGAVLGHVNHIAKSDTSIRHVLSGTELNDAGEYNYCMIAEALYRITHTKLTSTDTIHHDEFDRIPYSVENLNKVMYMCKLTEVYAESRDKTVDLILHDSIMTNVDTDVINIWFLVAIAALVDDMIMLAEYALNKKQ